MQSIKILVVSHINTFIQFKKLIQNINILFENYPTIRDTLFGTQLTASIAPQTI